MRSQRRRTCLEKLDRVGKFPGAAERGHYAGARNAKYFEAGAQVIVGVDDNGEFVTRSIEDIREGDYVLAGDENDPSAPPTLRRVTQVFIKTTHGLRVLSFVGADGSTTTLNTTDEHPFFVVDRGWTRADQLQIGDTLVQPDGSFVTLTASQIEPRSQGVTVYNLEVEGGHTYFVDDAASGAAVWVHNACAGAHHLLPRSLGSKTPYRHSSLTPLNKLRHTKAHRELSRHLAKQTKTLPNGTKVDMLPRRGNPGTRVQQNFSKAEREAALHAFYKEYNGGEFYTAFLNELKVAKINKWW